MEVSLANKRRRLEARRQEAIDRQAQRETRSHKQQLELLDQRLGKDVGAKRERERLSSLIEEAEARSKRQKKTKTKSKEKNKKNR